MVVPLYLAEFAPAEQRGRITSLNQLMIVGGILLAFIVNAILASSENWRLMLGSPPCRRSCCWRAWFIPETPRHLVHTGDEETAHDVLDDLPGDEPPGERIEEIKEVQQEQ